MYKTWSTSAGDAGNLAQSLEAHLNEFAEDIVSVSYAVDGEHHVLVVYRPVEITLESADEAVAVAEQIIDTHHG